MPRRGLFLPCFWDLDGDLEEGHWDGLVRDLLVVQGQLGAPDHGRERVLFGIDDLEEFDSGSHCGRKKGFGLRSVKKKGLQVRDEGIKNERLVFFLKDGYRVPHLYEKEKKRKKKCQDFGA